MPLTRKRADFVQVLPGVFLALQPLDALRFGFLHFGLHAPPFLAAKRKISLQKEKPTGQICI